MVTYLQPWLRLRFLQYWLHFRCFHDVTLDLQLPRHEQPLRLGLAAG